MQNHDVARGNFRRLFEKSHFIFRQKFRKYVIIFEKKNLTKYSAGID